MPMFILSGTHPFALSQRREEPRCSDISHPGLQRGVGDDNFSVNGDPGQHRPLGKMGTLPGSPFRLRRDLRKRKMPGMRMCLPQQTEKSSVVFSKYFLGRGVTGRLAASETGITSDLVSMSFFN